MLRGRSIIDAMRTERVRIYAVVSAALTLAVAIGFTNLPVAAILGLVTAILGGGEATRASVTPNQTVDKKELAAYEQGEWDTIAALRKRAGV